MNIFEKIYDRIQDDELLLECDGGGCGGGDASPGGPSSPAGGITSDSVLGPSGGFEKGEGCLGKGDFHIPFPIMPCIYRWGKSSASACNGGGSRKKKKKGLKTVSVKNPYVKGMKTIVAEDEPAAVHYVGEARLQFDRVVGDAEQAYTGVLNYNAPFKLAWMIREDGILRMYKPMDVGDFWTIYATVLEEDGTIMLDYKAGKYPTEQAALDAVYKAAEKHKKALEERLKEIDESVQKVISDNTIDGFGAKYYCIFADEGFRKAVEEVKTSPRFRKMGENAIRKNVESLSADQTNGKRLNEFVVPVLAPLAVPAATEAAAFVGSMVAAWFSAKAATGAVMPLLKQDPVAVSKTIADTPVADLGKITVEAPSIASGGGESGGFWKWFLSTAVGGLLTSAGHFIAGLLGLGAAAAAHITVGLSTALACGCAALAKHMVPVFASWIKKIRADGVIARTVFESDGEKYDLRYSMKDNKWHLFMFGNRLFSRRALATPAQAQQLMETDFFKAFRGRCSEILHEYLDDPESVAVMTTLIGQNEDELKYANELIARRAEVLERFDSPTFVTEKEEED